MITKLQNPVAALVLSLVLSVTLGVALCWRAAGPLLQLAAAAHLKPAAATKERARLHQQADLLDQRAARVTAEEKELGKIRADIETLRKEIGDKVIEISVDETKNLKTLAQTYTNLSPHAAVAILREMDDVTTVKILSLMKPDVVGALFEEMSRTPDNDGTLARRAALLTEKLRLMKAAKPPSPG